MYSSTAFVSALIFCCAAVVAQEAKPPTVTPASMSFTFFLAPPEDESTTTRDAGYWLAGAADFDERIRNDPSLDSLYRIARSVDAAASALQSLRTIARDRPVSVAVIESLWSLAPSGVRAYQDAMASIQTEIYQTFDPNDPGSPGMKITGTNTRRWTKGYYGFSSGVPLKSMPTDTTLTTTSDAGVAGTTSSFSPTATSTAGVGRIVASKCLLAVGVGACVALL